MDHIIPFVAGRHAEGNQTRQRSRRERDPGREVMSKGCHNKFVAHFSAPDTIDHPISQHVDDTLSVKGNVHFMDLGVNEQASAKVR